MPGSSGIPDYHGKASPHGTTRFSGAVLSTIPSCQTNRPTLYRGFSIQNYVWFPSALPWIAGYKSWAGMMFGFFAVRLCGLSSFQAWFSSSSFCLSWLPWFPLPPQLTTFTRVGPERLASPPLLAFRLMRLRRTRTTPRQDTVTRP